MSRSVICQERKARKEKKTKNSASEIWPFHTFIKLHVFLYFKAMVPRATVSGGMGY